MWISARPEPTRGFPELPGGSSPTRALRRKQPPGRRGRCGAATLGPARHGGCRPAFVGVPASRRQLHGPCLARNARLRRTSRSTTARFQRLDAPSRPTSARRLTSQRSSHTRSHRGPAGVGASAFVPATCKRLPVLRARSGPGDSRPNCRMSRQDGVNGGTPRWRQWAASLRAGRSVGCLSVASETLEAPPDFHDLLRAANTAVLSTVLPDGSLQGSPVWYWFDGVLVHVSTLAGRRSTAICDAILGSR